MSNEQNYPFKLINIFFVNLQLNRINKLTPALELHVHAEAKVVEPKFPRVQYNLRLRTLEAEPLSFQVEIVSLYDYVGEKKEYDKELNREFMKHVALPNLWANARQMIGMITSQMGMQAVNINIPRSDNIDMQQEKPEENKTEKTGAD